MNAPYFYRMFRTVRTTPQDPDFQALIPLLDAELAISDGEEHDFYKQYNGTDEIKYAVVAYDGDRPIGCGAIKHFDTDTMEVKRMFVHRDYRGRSAATQLLSYLEVWTQELGYQRCILETGVRQLAAIRLYEKNSYRRIENYGQYAGAVNSVCMEKRLNAPKLK
ncbi:MAG: GNAT family N-acetyltransferase [Bacteroidota bacterium]